MSTQDFSKEDLLTLLRLKMFDLRPDEKTRQDHALTVVDFIQLVGSSWNKITKEDVCNVAKTLTPYPSNVLVEIFQKAVVE